MCIQRLIYAMQVDYLTSPMFLLCRLYVSLMYRGTSCDCQVFQLDVGRTSTDSQVPRLTVPKKTLSAHQKCITNCLFFGSDQQVTLPLDVTQILMFKMVSV